MPKIEAIVAGVVLSDKLGRYLLVQEKQAHVYGLWNLPAGHVDKGETLLQAAIREAREETGLEVKITNTEPIYVFFNEATRRQLNSFRAKIVRGKLTVQKSELLDAKWFSYDEILGLDKKGKLRTEWVMESIRKVEEDENIRH